MKKLVLTIFLLNYCIVSSQVNVEKYIISNYVETYEWNEAKGDYVLQSGSWYKWRIDPYEEYYLAESNDDGDIKKTWWYHGEEFLDFDGDAYYTKDERKVVFNYDTQEIWFFYDYYKRKSRYQKVVILSKLTTYDKK